MDSYSVEQIKQGFLIVCRKCGSENVLLHYEPEHNYSELTSDAATLSLSCDSCKYNDVVVYP